MVKKVAAVASKKAAGGMSKMDGVKKALIALGGEALPVQIQDFLKKQFNIEIGTDVISTYKADIRRKALQAAAATPKAAANKPAVKTPAAKKPVAKQATVKAPAAPQAKQVTAPHKHAAEISLDDIATVKNLLSRVAAENLKTLIELLGT